MGVTIVLRSVHRFVAERYGSGATVVDPVALAGNSGQTIKFTVRDHSGATADVLVARWAPSGVSPVGHFDLERQAGFLRAAADAMIPVPEVLFAANRSPVFPTATMVTRWVRGYSVPDWGGGAHRRIAVFEQAVDVLARIHALPVEQTPAGSDQPRSPRAEIDHWSTVVERSRSDWCGRLNLLAEKLVAASPAETRPAVTHGDFRLGNLVVGDTGIRAVVDWELARAGPVCLDLAWLLLYLDAPWWYHGRDGGVTDATRRRVEDRYPSSTEDLTWFEAAVRFKQAAIIAYNHRLHVTGKRPDPHWERMLRAVPVLLDSAERLLPRGFTS